VRPGINVHVPGRNDPALDAELVSARTRHHEFELAISPRCRERWPEIHERDWLAPQFTCRIDAALDRGDVRLDLLDLDPVLDAIRNLQLLPRVIFLCAGWIAVAALANLESSDIAPRDHVDSHVGRSCWHRSEP